jgi:hypothetical protein
MRRIVLALLSTVSGMVMLFSYHTSTQGGSTTAVGLGGGSLGGGSLGGGSLGQAGDGSAAGTDPNAGGGSTPQQNGSGGSSSGSSTGSGSKIVKGDTVDTRWGPVQVAIKVAGAKITAVDALIYPNENGRDQEINSYAIPALNQEVMDAQGANIDMISGATVTSGGYIQSLQSALDKAGM